MGLAPRRSIHQPLPTLKQTQWGISVTHDSALIEVNNQSLAIIIETTAAIPSPGIQAILMKVQKAVQPCQDNPEQSSAEAQNPKGIAASRAIRACGMTGACGRG